MFDVVVLLLLLVLVVVAMEVMVIMLLLHMLLRVLSYYPTMAVFHSRLAGDPFPQPPLLWWGGEDSAWCSLATKEKIDTDLLLV